MYPFGPTSSYSIPLRRSQQREDRELTALIPVKEGVPRESQHFYLPLWDTTPQTSRFIEKAKIVFEEKPDDYRFSFDGNWLGKTSYDKKAPEHLKGSPSEPLACSRFHLNLPKLFNQEPDQLKQELRKAAGYFQALPTRSALNFEIHYAWNEQPLLQRVLRWHMLPYLFRKEASPAPLKLHNDPRYRPVTSLPVMTIERPLTLPQQRAALDAAQLTPKQQQAAVAAIHLTPEQREAALDAAQLTPEQWQAALNAIQLTSSQTTAATLGKPVNFTPAQQRALLAAVQLTPQQQQAALALVQEQSTQAQQQAALHAARLTPAQQQAALKAVLSTPEQHAEGPLLVSLMTIEQPLTLAQQQAALVAAALTPAQQQAVLAAIQLTPEQRQMVQEAAELTPTQLQAVLDAMQLTTQQVTATLFGKPVYLTPEQQQAALTEARLTPQQQQAALTVLLERSTSEQQQAALNALELTPAQQQAALNAVLEHLTPEQQQALALAQTRLQHHAVNSPIGRSGNPLLHRAIATPLPVLDQEAILNLVTRLVEDYGAAVNQVNPKGETPLHLAVSRQLPEVVAFLMSHGADPDLKTTAGQSAWDLARAHNHPAILAALATQQLSPEQLLPNLISEEGQWGYQGRAEHRIELPDHHQGDYFHIKAPNHEGHYWLTYHHAGTSEQYRFLFNRPEQALWAMEQIRGLLRLPEWKSRNAQGQEIAKRHLADVDTANFRNHPDQRLADTTLGFLKSCQKEARSGAPFPTPEGFHDLMGPASGHEAGQALITRPMDFLQTTHALIQSLDLKHPDSPFHADNTSVINIDVQDQDYGNDDAPVALTLTTAENAARPGEAHALYRDRLDAYKAIKRLQLEDYRFQVPDQEDADEISDWIKNKREKSEQDTPSPFVTGLSANTPKLGRLDWEGDEDERSNNPRERIEYRRSGEKDAPFTFPDNRKEKEKAAGVRESRHQGDAALYMADQALRHPQVFQHPDLGMNKAFDKNMTEEGFDPIVNKQFSVPHEAREKHAWNHHTDQAVRIGRYALAGDIQSLADFERKMQPFASRMEASDRNRLVAFILACGGALAQTFSNLGNLACYRQQPLLVLSSRPWLQKLEEGEPEHPLLNRPVQIQVQGIDTQPNGEKVFIFNQVLEKTPAGEHQYLDNDHFIQSQQRYNAQALLDAALRDNGSTGLGQEENTSDSPQGIPLATQEMRSLWAWFKGRK